MNKGLLLLLILSLSGLSGCSMLSSREDQAAPAPEQIIPFKPRRALDQTSRAVVVRGGLRNGVVVASGQNWYLGTPRARMGRFALETSGSPRAKAVPAKPEDELLGPPDLDNLPARHYVFFDTDQSRLRGIERERLLEFARKHLEPGQPLAVHGFASAKGSPAHNLRLSKARARNVARLLRAQGWDVRAVIACGEQAAHVPPQDNPEDRRVEVGPLDLLGYSCPTE